MDTSLRYWNRLFRTNAAQKAKAVSLCGYEIKSQSSRVENVRNGIKDAISSNTNENTHTHLLASSSQSVDLLV